MEFDVERIQIYSNIHTLADQLPLKFSSSTITAMPLPNANISPTAEYLAAEAVANQYSAAEKLKCVLRNDELLQAFLEGEKNSQDHADEEFAKSFSLVWGKPVIHIILFV